MFKFKKPQVKETVFIDSFKLTEGTPVNAVAAIGTLTFSDAVTDAEVVVIGDETYEFDTDAEATITEGNIRVDVSGGATAANAVTALVAAISDDKDYSAADGAGDTVVVTYGTSGIVGNAVEVSTTCAAGSWGSEVTTLGDTTAGVDGTVVDSRGFWYEDDDYLYCTTDANTTADANWKRIAKGSAY